MTIQEIQEELIEEFGFFDDWMERYEHLISLGKSLPVLDAAHKVDQNLIKGCQSKVWLHATMQDDKLKLQADSDAVLTKGIVSMLIRVFDGQSPQDIISAELQFLDQIGLKEHLSPTRANGLMSMIKQIKFYAVALHAKHQN